MKWLRAFASLFRARPPAPPPIEQTWAVTPEEEFGAGKFRRVRGVYADLGETVTCENGHPIVHFKRAVRVGEMFDPSALVHWWQPMPEIGQMEAPCVICGKRWFKGHYFHFSDGWRIG